MRKFWPIRNAANFTLTLIGATGLGLLYYSINNQRIFSNSPIVNQAVKVLGHNSAIRNLIGYPVAYTGSFSNSYNIKEEEQYYNFQVKGSKTHTMAELNATKMKVSDINAKIKKTKQLQNQIKFKASDLEKRTEQLKKLKKNQKNSALQEIKRIEGQLFKLKQELKVAQVSKIECLKKFYIPDDELYQKVIRNKNPQAIINQEIYLYGIDGLSANLPNKNTINIIPTQATNIQSSKGSQAYDNKSKKLLETQQITEGYLRNMLHQNIGELTETQLQSYGKHKTLMMYGKYNGYRIGFTVLITFGLGMMFVAWHKFRIRSVGGTAIAYQAEQFLLNHPKTTQVLKVLHKSKSNVKFGKTFQGGRKDENFNCSVDIDGISGGKAYFQGIYKESEGIPRFKKLGFQYKQGNKTKKIDLL